MFRNSAALFLLDGTITHRPKDKATESKYRAYLQAYRQRWNTTQLLTAHISASLSAQTARPYTDQRKLSLGNQGQTAQRWAHQKENALHSIVALLNHSRTTTKWRAKKHLARCERTDTTPTQLRSDTALSQTKGRNIGGKNENVYDPLPQSNVSLLQRYNFLRNPNTLKC